MLIECEPAIKSIIVHFDSVNNDIIIEDLDETHLVIKENMVQVLKQKLEEVSFLYYMQHPSLLTVTKSASRRHTAQRSLCKTANEAPFS